MQSSILTLARLYPAPPVLRGGPEKPLYRRWWFIAAFVVCGMALIGSFLTPRFEERAPAAAERERPEAVTPDRAILDPAVIDEAEGSLAGE